jgi:hypothetical protein
VAGRRGLIFCTAFIEGSPRHPARRWTDWFDYYRRLFPDWELRAFNDGPVPPSFDRERYPVAELLPHLGTHLGAKRWGFPGWRRSFRAALVYAVERGYERVAHLESDLYIRSRFRAKYRAAFRQPGYFTGYTRRFTMIETALQVLNDPPLVRRLIEFLGDDANLNEQERTAEAQFAMLQYPNDDVFVGERLEGDVDAVLRDRRMEYFAQCDYREHRRRLEARGWPASVDILAQRAWRKALRVARGRGGGGPLRPPIDEADECSERAQRPAPTGPSV